MSRPYRRAALHTAAAATAVVAVLGLAACSSSGQTSTSSDAQAAKVNPADDRLAADPLSAVRAAADITGHNGSLQDVTTLHTVAAKKQMLLHGTGVYDYSAHLGRLEVSVPAGSGSAPAGRLTEIVSPGVVYLQNSGAKVPAGKWVKLSVQQLGDGNLVSSGATDPASAADALRGAQTATLVDSATVDGVVLKHYRGTLDLTAAAKATGGPSSAGLALAAHTFTVKAVPYDVWLDEHGRINKIVEVFTFAQVPGSTAPKDQTMVTSTSVFSGFGSPVQVTVPSDADIVAPSAAAGSK
ncbi:hypothetical protein [Streptacidiphilus jiangxiensis]|uniref:Lipoprotein LprG n=1 Tax=Streptacidiphilus jiangxiensis TaxID=235985 RepID=A0A1H7XYP7_STRJI|nr:hypothetical protein [Streptacidiphilus jiangxiensis]SEM39086.1 hypothetical protein SAMN05414137_12612 [Streptacidiphilus jiangxiensis]